MADRYDLLTARKGRDGRSFFTKVGVMFANRNGDGFSLSFEALPLPSLNDKGELETRVLAMVPRDNDRAAPRNQAGPSGRSAAFDDDADAPPF
jgi:hypothetical protein